MTFVKKQFQSCKQISLLVFLVLAEAACMEHTGEALYWQDPPQDTRLNWEDASSYCESLNDNETNGWRLPSIDDLRMFVHGCSATAYGGPCPINDIDRLQSSSLSCLGCKQKFGVNGIHCYWDDWFSGPCGSGYWSSSIQYSDDDEAFFIDFTTGAVFHGSKSETRNVRCVEAKR